MPCSQVAELRDSLVNTAGAPLPLCRTSTRSRNALCRAGWQDAELAPADARPRPLPPGALRVASLVRRAHAGCTAPRHKRAPRLCLRSPGQTAWLCRTPPRCPRHAEPHTSRRDQHKYRMIQHHYSKSPVCVPPPVSAVSGVIRRGLGTRWGAHTGRGRGRGRGRRAGRSTAQEDKGQQ